MNEAPMNDAERLAGSAIRASDRIPSTDQAIRQRALYMIIYHAARLLAESVEAGHTSIITNDRHCMSVVRHIVGKV